MITFSSNPVNDLRSLIAHRHNSHTLVLMPERLKANKEFVKLSTGIIDLGKVITFNDSPETKTLESVEAIWEQLFESGATRSSLIINLGGGTTSDVGGFAAACWMRGINYINIPTTLLAAIDASVGGKTGVNFHGVKNIIGNFHSPLATIISPIFYQTLPNQELLSGFGEMLKHSLLENLKSVLQLIHFNLWDVSDSDQWLNIIRQSVAIKEKIVAQDPFEKGLRKSLNLGHTIGHAFEALSMERHAPISHGIAVAHGLVAELILSNLHLGFPSDLFHTFTTFVKQYFPPFPINCDDYERLLNFMKHDKKNPDSTQISFVLLRSPGDIAIDVNPDEKEITAALDIYRDMMGY